MWVGMGVFSLGPIHSQLFHDAAAAGHLDAQCNLGLLHENGCDAANIERDLDVAMHWYVGH